MTTDAGLTRRKLLKATAATLTASACAPAFGMAAAIESNLPVRTSPGMFDDVLNALTDHTGVSRADIMSEDRSVRIVSARQRGMYIYRELSGRSLPEIGRRFGGRMHVTVLYAARKIESLMVSDPAYRNDLHRLIFACIAEIERNNHAPDGCFTYTAWRERMSDTAFMLG